MATKKLPRAPECVLSAREKVAPILPGLERLGWKGTKRDEKEFQIKARIWDLLIVARGSGIDPRSILGSIEWFLGEEQEPIFRGVEAALNSIAGGATDVFARDCKTWSIAHWSLFVSALPQETGPEIEHAIAELMAKSRAGRHVREQWDLRR